MSTKLTIIRMMLLVAMIGIGSANAYADPLSDALARLRAEQSQGATQPAQQEQTQQAPVASAQAEPTCQDLAAELYSPVMTGPTLQWLHGYFQRYYPQVIANLQANEMMAAGLSYVCGNPYNGWWPLSKAVRAVYPDAARALRARGQ
jgi:hypothetical protein